VAHVAEAGLAQQVLDAGIAQFGNLIAHQFGEFFDWPLGAAMSFVVLLSGGFVLAMTSLLMSLWRPR